MVVNLLKKDVKQKFHNSMAHLISTNYRSLLHFLTHDLSITKMMIKRKWKSKGYQVENIASI